MARIEFSANPTHLPEHPRPRPRPRPPPLSGRVETRNSVDYLSELPNDIILHILSFLTTKEAIKTSVLSRQWRSTWTANPHITFFMPLFRNSTMFQSHMSFVDGVLLRCTAIRVKSFLLDAPGPFNYWPQSRIDKWLQFAVEHHAEEVTMTLTKGSIRWLPEDGQYALPQFFFRYTKLVSFHVCACRFSQMGAVNWSSLKRLRVDNAELEDNAITRILSGCPVLEFFELNGCQGYEHIEVASESRGLRELVINSHVLGPRKILKISAPHLLKLRLLGPSHVYEEFKVDRVSSLIEAELNFDLIIYGSNKSQTIQACGDLVKRLLQSLHCVPKLVMGSKCLQMLSAARIVSLPSLECRHLVFHISDHGGDHGIAKILESSPRLEKLFLQITCGRSPVCRQFVAEEFWNSARRRIHKCLIHLKNVEIVDPGAGWGEWGPVLFQVKFLLENAPWLDKIVINSNNSGKSRDVHPWVLVEVAQIILLHPNRSPNLKLILSYPSQGCPSTSVL